MNSLQGLRAARKEVFVERALVAHGQRQQRAGGAAQRAVVARVRTRGAGQRARSGPARHARAPRRVLALAVRQQRRVTKPFICLSVSRAN